jgi:hypothetical protein
LFLRVVNEISTKEIHLQLWLQSYIQLGNETNPAFIDQIYGEVSQREVAKALDLVQANQDESPEAWCNIHE